MRICYFGTYEKRYPRNSIFLKGLYQNEVEVYECHVPLWEKTSNKDVGFGFSLKFLLSVLAAQIRLIFQYIFFVPRHEIIIIGYIGHLDIYLAKVLAYFGRKKLVFNPLISLYDTVIMDRQYYPKSSYKAYLMRFLDRSACKMSDLVLLDTDSHIKYFRDTLDLSNIAFQRLFVGADNHVFYPEHRVHHENIFNVMFFGKYTPLQGISKIIEAANILKSESTIKFTLVGKGQLRNKMENKINDLGLKNITLLDWIPYNQLSLKMAEADLILGIFGDSDKAKRVIPNKVFQALAVEKPILTADTPAIRELLIPDRHIFITEAKPIKIAEKIQFIRSHEKNRNEVSKNGFHFFKENLSINKLGADLKTILECIK